MEKRLTMILAGLFLSIGMALAQTQVTGTVTSAEDGEPVVGASVKVVGANTGTMTNAEGRFSLSAPADARLTITFLGMEPQTVKAGQNLRIVLHSQDSQLEELVVIGYGSAKKIGSITGNVATVNAEKLKNAPSASALDALQGQVAGLSVLSSSGVAGDNAVSVNLHGIGSLGASSTPLYVLDGIPTSSRTIMAMNPNDIKTMTVLKDASATSIYGSRAANGVIYVTTRNGGYNTRATVTFRTQYGWSTLANRGFYDKFMSGDELYNFWINSGLGTADALKKKYDDNGYRENTKWYEIFQQFNNPQTQNDLTIEGGSERVSYLVAASQFHQRGTTIGNYYDRYTFRTNLDAKPKTWLRTGVNMNLSYDKRQQNANWGDSGSNANYTSGGLSFLLNPLYPHIDPSTGQEYQRYPFGIWNQEYMISKNPNVNSRYGLVGNAYVEITPIEGLKITSRGGTDLYFTRNNYKSYPSYIPNNGAGVRRKTAGYSYSHTITNTVEYSFDLDDDNHFTVLGGQEGVINSYDYFSALSRSQLVDGLLNLQHGKQSTYSMTESNTQSRYLSFFGRVNYNLMDRYFLDLSIRNDASSRFGANKRNATFWAAGAMWKVKQEDFMKPYTWLNDLNIKVSYGTQGNSSIDDYEALALLSATTDYNVDNAIIFSQAYNPNLTWETQKLFTVGVNGRVFDRVDFDIQFYNRTTSNMLMGVPYPYTTGFSSVTENVGSLRNTGIDINLGVDILKTPDYYLRFNTAFNYNSQKVTELFDGRQRWEIANTLVAYVVNNPVMFYLPLYAGVDPADGAPMWYKAGSDKDKTTRAETTKNYDEAELTQNSGKKRYAPVNGGFGFQGGWKGISLSADFSYVLGKYLVNNDAYFYDNPNVVGTSYNQDRAVTDCWSSDNTTAKYPQWSEGYVLQFDDHLLENASFLRLKNLQIAYQLPKVCLNWQNVVQGVRVSFTGRNLMTVTNYKGMDPEVASNLTYGKVGNSKQFLFGLEVTF